MFKPGDKVRCIQPFPPYQCAGDMFTVENVYPDGVVFEGSGSPTRWNVARFELVEREQGIAFRVRKIVEASVDGGKTWVPVPAAEDL